MTRTTGGKRRKRKSVLPSEPPCEKQLGVMEPVSDLATQKPLEAKAQAAKTAPQHRELKRNRKGQFKEVRRRAAGATLALAKAKGGTSQEYLLIPI